jgi:hypothetical protein
MENTPKIQNILGKPLEIIWDTRSPNKIFGAREKKLEPPGKKI